MCRLSFKKYQIMGTKSGAYQDVYIKREDEMVSLKNDVKNILLAKQLKNPPTGDFL